VWVQVRKFVRFKLKLVWCVNELLVLVGICCKFLLLPRCMKCRRGLAMKIRSARPPVRLSNARILTKGKKNQFRFLYHTKEHLAKFSDKKNGWWGRPLLPGFRLVSLPTSMLLNNLERRNSPNFAVFSPNLIALRANYVTVVVHRPIISPSSSLPL